MHKEEHSTSLIEEIRRHMEEADTKAKAQQILTKCRDQGLISDWDDGVSEKPKDFASLVVAICKVIPNGNSLEVGVFRGGTSGILIQCAEEEGFHVSIDPFGLPSQSYPEFEGYEDWKHARETLLRLHMLASEYRVNFCHYLMGSVQFADADLLTHPGTLRIVHLDGPHDQKTVLHELRYFRTRIAGPCVFIMDDDNPNKPDVRNALAKASNGMEEILHRVYDTEWGEFGFSAWLHYAPLKESIPVKLLRHARRT